MMPTITPYRSGRQPGPDGFWQQLRAEFTKLRTVRGWVIALIGVAALTAVFPILVSKIATTNDPITCVRGQCQVEGQNFATGPAGTAVTDLFYFVHQPIGAAGSITVAVTALHGSGSGPQLPPGAAPAPRTEPWAKAGIIIKASTKPGSAYAAVMVTGGHGVRMQYDYTGDVPGRDVSVSAAAPQWLRLTRSGDTITAAESAAGTHWTTVGSVSLPGLPSTAQAGLFVASPSFQEPVGTGDSSVGGLTQATADFDHLSLHGGTSGQTWTGTQIGTAPGGGPAQAPGANGGPIHCHDCGATPLGHGFTARDGSYALTGSGDIAPFVPIVDPLHVTFFTTLFGLIAVIALGTLFITAEYRRGLIRATVTASPRRGRILLAKAIIIGAATFVAALIGAAIAFPLVEHRLVANDWRPPVWPQFSLASGTGLQIVLGTAAIAAGAAVLGLAAGVAFRRSASAVMLVIGVVIVPLVLSVVLPITPASWLLRLTPAAAFSAQQSVPKYAQVSATCSPYHACLPLAPWAGLAVMAAWAVVAMAGAIFLLRRRDI
jgi:hypothetical protein